MKKKHEMIKHCHIYFPDPKKHGRLSKECKKFFWELLDKNVSTRLGTKGGLKEILEHPWLSGIDINGLQKRLYEAPFEKKDEHYFEDFEDLRSEFIEGEINIAMTS